jgi:ammonia channel protein AmtB
MRDELRVVGGSVHGRRREGCGGWDEKEIRENVIFYTAREWHFFCEIIYHRYSLSSFSYIVPKLGLSPILPPELPVVVQGGLLMTSGWFSFMSASQIKLHQRITFRTHIKLFEGILSTHKLLDDSTSESFTVMKY